MTLDLNAFTELREALTPLLQPYANVFYRHPGYVIAHLAVPEKSYNDFWASKEGNPPALTTGVCKLFLFDGGCATNIPVDVACVIRASKQSDSVEVLNFLPDFIKCA